VLRGDGHHQINAAVGIAHVFLPFDKMLCEGCTHFGCITVELENAFGFAAVAEPGLLEKGRSGMHAVGIG